MCGCVAMQGADRWQAPSQAPLPWNIAPSWRNILVYENGTKMCVCVVFVCVFGVAVLVFIFCVCAYLRERLANLSGRAMSSRGRLPPPPRPLPCLFHLPPDGFFLGLPDMVAADSKATPLP